MKYFSKVSIKSKKHIIAYLEQVRQLGDGDMYASHQWLWKLFPNATKRNFIHMKDIRTKTPTFYIISDDKPVSGGLFDIDVVREYTPKVVKGGKYRFEMIVNPTIDRKIDGKSRRTSVMTEAFNDFRKSGGVLSSVKNTHIKSWLDRRGGRNGFECVRAEVVSDSKSKFKKKPQHNKYITTSLVRVVGEFVVTDIESFGDMLANGLGKGRAFGCGMVLVK